ncbi:hypothetical protein [Hydrogenophaga sp.]|uniref:hypothetical protein n=1 Tax=Hydrogenophaga sp. TaxID=1904254 RepID=UPI003D0BFBCD
MPTIKWPLAMRRPKLSAFGNATEVPMVSPVPVPQQSPPFWLEALAAMAAAH